MIKKLTPASIVSQKKWAGFSTPVKRGLLKRLPDSDKDSVPNKYDCKPSNKRRQESFLPVDATYLNSNKPVVLGKKVGEGKYGEVFELQGNRNLVVKAPKGFSNKTGRSVEQRKEDTESYLNSRWGVNAELDFIRENNLTAEPLFSPSVIVNLGTNDLNNGDYYGVVRPKVSVIPDWHKANKNYNIPKLTDAKLEELRRKIIHLSHKGYIFNDGLQLGMDKAGRLLIFDQGATRRDPNDTEAAFRVNSYQWEMFLILIDKDIKKYGSIRKSERY
jgi:hypothetical protein